MESNSTKQLCEHVYPSSIQLPLLFLKPLVHPGGCGYSERLAKKKARVLEDFFSSFFFPSPSITKISDVDTSHESLPSKSQHSSIALWDHHTFIKRKTSLSTGAKHTHKNQPCTQTHRRMRRKNSSEYTEKRSSVHTLVRSMPSLS